MLALWTMLILNLDTILWKFCLSTTKQLFWLSIKKGAAYTRKRHVIEPLKKPIATELLFSVLRVVATGRGLLPRLQSTHFFLLQVLIWMKGIRSQSETSRCRSEAAAGLVAVIWTLKTRSPGTATSTGLMTSGPRSPTLLSSDRFVI